MIIVDIDGAEVDLADLCLSAADIVAVTVNMYGFCTTVVSAYNSPNAQWDITDTTLILLILLILLSTRCPRRLII